MAGSLSEFFFGRPDKLQQLNRFTPQQMQQQSGVGQLGYQGLQNTPLDFKPIREQAIRNFQTNTIPGLLERLQAFGGQGEGALRSGALGGQLGSAAADLESQLAGQESQYNLQKFAQLLNAFGMGQQPQFEHYYQPGTQGLFGGLAGAAGSALPLLALSGAGLPAMGSLRSTPTISSLLSSLGSNPTQSSTGPSTSGVGSPVSTMQGSTNPAFSGYNIFRASSRFPGGMPNIF